MASEERHVVHADAAGLRIDKWLARLPSIGSRSKARHVVDSGKVRVDGSQLGPGDAGFALAEGAVVEIAWSRPGTSRRRTAARAHLDRAGIDIVHEAPSFVVVNKPAGLLTAAADREQRRHRDTLRKRVSAWAGATTWPVHRIDRDTTGLVAFARSEPVRDALMAQWRDRTPDRVYLLVVEGDVGGRDGTWSDWMAWDSRNRIQRPCEPDVKGAFHAQAHYRVRERLRNATVLEVTLVSGRRNQIRLQAMLRDHPLIGEGLYRKEGPPSRHRFARQALHAWRLAFDHPDTGERLQFEAPLPPDMAALIRSLSPPASPRSAG